MVGFSEQNIKRLLHYWWVSLADEDLMGLKETAGVTTIFRCVESGCLDEELVKALYKLWRDARRREPTSTDLAKAAQKEDPSEIAVTILAKGFVRKHAHGQPVRGNDLP